MNVYVCVCAGFGLAQCVRQCVWPQNNVRLTRPWLKKPPKTLHTDFQTHTATLHAYVCVPVCCFGGDDGKTDE